MPRPNRSIGLEYKQSEEFTIAELRGLLNVPEGKLERFADFNKYCLKVAQDEINKLCPFWVEFTPIDREQPERHRRQAQSTVKQQQREEEVEQHLILKRPGQWMQRWGGARP